MNDKGLRMLGRVAAWAVSLLFGLGIVAAIVAVTLSLPLRVDVLISSQHRDGRWHTACVKYLAEHKECVVCGMKAETVHHAIPVHVRPELEMVEGNWRAVCDRCHLLVCHCGNWRLYNRHLDEDARMLRSHVEEAKTATH